MNKRTASSFHLSFIHEDEDETIQGIEALMEYIEQYAANLIKNNRKIESVQSNPDELHEQYLCECIENGEL